MRRIPASPAYADPAEVQEFRGVLRCRRNADQDQHRARVRVLRRASRIAGRKHAAHDQDRVDWEAALPEIQRENLKLEVVELSKVLDTEGEHVAELQSAYIVAEDLALRQIQQEENVPLLRHGGVGDVPFDAVFVKDDVLNCCEVSFLVAPDLRQDKIDAMMRKVKRVKEGVAAAGSSLTIRMMLILITQLSAEDDERLRSVLNKRRFSGTPVDIDIRLLDFESLQKIYVTD